MRESDVDVLACPHCDRMFHAAPALLGKAIRCRGCRKPFAIPADPKTAELGPDRGEPQPEILFAIECVIDGVDARECPSCGRTFSMQPRFVGKKIRCRGCRVPFVVTATTRPADPSTAIERQAPATPAKKATPQPAPIEQSTPVAEPEQVAAEATVIYEDSGDVLDVIPVDEPVLVAVRPRRRTRRRPGPVEALAPVIAVALGGLTALPVTQLILWWGLGMDPLHIGRAMPRALKGIVPMKFQR